MDIPPARCYNAANGFEYASDQQKSRQIFILKGIGTVQMLPDWNPQMEELAREVFSQVRTSIVMKMRFLDMAVFRLKPFAAPVTLATDGDHLFYHPVWLLKRYREESPAVTRDYMHVLLQIMSGSWRMVLKNDNIYDHGKNDHGFLRKYTRY